MIKLGSVFSGIGGFELGLERALPQCKTIWQVEQDTFCQSILRKHWADAIIYDDIRTVGAHNLEPVDVLCGGFPCQDISTSGQRKGINHGKKSSLYFEMFRVICEIRPRIIVIENVAAISTVGGHDVFRTLAHAGYDAEWCTIRTGADFGLPHIRRRWFCTAYSNSIRQQRQRRHNQPQYTKKNQKRKTGRFVDAFQRSAVPYLCTVHDGFSRNVARQMMQALGNAITPQASEWIGRQILQSGLLDDLIQ